jgi:hypothetical protein
MAPVEFEKELQKRLRARRVEPRADSWDRIEARLEAERPSGKRRDLFWKIGVAASLVCLLGYFLFRQPDRVVPDGTPVVETPALVIPSTSEEPLGPVETNTREPASPSREVLAGAGDRDPGPASGLPANGVAIRGESPPVKRELADQPFASVPSGLQGSAGVPGPEIPDLASGGERVTDRDDAEVEALLVRALEELEARDPQRDTTGVNPATLLDEAESELDQTFREQILRKLKMGFSKVRTGVADRSQ